MARLILDTHAFLWFVFDDDRLSETAATAISDPETDATLSVVSLWEITIKSQLGNLELGMGLQSFLRRFVSERDLQVLPIELRHLVAYHALPQHHRDPFDRLLVAQATLAGAPVVTADPSFAAYEVDVLW